MRSPAARILRGQHAGKGVDQFATDRDETRRFDANRDTPAQRHQPRRLHVRRPDAARDTVEPVLQLRLDTGRQVMEQCAVRVEDIALGRKMFATQPVEPALIGAAEQGGDDDGSRLQAQIST